MSYISLVVFDMYLCSVVLVFFFFKQKTAYEMRISDWSSDVCSSDLRCAEGLGDLQIVGHTPPQRGAPERVVEDSGAEARQHRLRPDFEEAVATECGEAAHAVLEPHRPARMLAPMAAVEGLVRPTRQVGHDRHRRAPGREGSGDPLQLRQDRVQERRGERSEEQRSELQSLMRI